MSIEERSGSDGQAEESTNEEVVEEIAEEQTSEQTEEQVLDSGDATQETTEEVKPENIAYSEYEKLLKEKEHLVKQTEDKTKFISEIIPKYKESAEAVNSLQNRLGELNQSIPTEGSYLTTEDFRAIQERDSIQQTLQATQSQNAEIHNRTVIESTYPDYSKNVDKIAAEMLRQGVAPDQVRIIQQSPYHFDSAHLPFVRSVIETVKAKEEVAGLRQKQSNGVNSVKSHVNKINRAASTSTLSNSVGVSEIKLPDDPKDQDSFISGLDDKALDELLNRG